MVRRLPRHNVPHPPSTALLERGTARRTIGLCRSLRLRELRREMHEGRNVVEPWHRAKDGIRFGTGGDIATHRREDQALAMRALPLLHNALVSSNTFMLHRVLREAGWATRVTTEDVRALTPLLSGHVSPSGPCRLDMQTRLDMALLLDAGHGSATGHLDPERRSPAHARRRRRAQAQQLALFSLYDAQGRRVGGW